MYLDDTDFARVIAATPLVAIDLLVHAPQDRVLLGKRRNRPACGNWFVPGGRIRKDEPWRVALRRIAATELGPAMADALEAGGQFVGVFDHLYDDNVFGQPGFGTHYVVIGWETRLHHAPSLVADAQHAALQWWTIPDLLASAEVHENTKRYFRAPAR